jgi:2-keto-4-pentenoate hydratase/2-oxohepta-3-ene-1,7-dioic acid hydratase in catechol pathway
MRLVRFNVKGETEERAGLVEDGRIRVLAGDVFGPYEKTGLVLGPHDIDLQPPVRPTKIIAVGLNYRDHAKEVGLPLPEEPMIFLKPPTAVIGPTQAIILPRMSSRVDFEAELGVVIGRRARRVPAERAFDYVLGYTCVNDVTARDLQSKDGQWTRSKGFDTFCPIGPAIETELDPSNLAVGAWLNGHKKQASRTDNLVFDVPTLIEFITGVMTLEPGDVISTGTPSGVGPLWPGDAIEIRIEGLGSLINHVVIE